MNQTGELKNVAASVRDRLLKISRDTGQEYQTLLIRYGIERLLYRLSISEHRQRFVLKGAQLFTVWHPVPHRITRDLDLLGFGGCEAADLVAVFRDLCTAVRDDDGLFFDAASVVGELIRAEELYSGVRVSFLGKIGGSRIPMQVDVAFGDSLAAPPVEIAFPSLLGMHPPLLRAYRMETTVAEKFDALLSLGILNSRMKDYFDLWFLSKNFAFDGALLAASIQSTCARRGHNLHPFAPLGLTEEFGNDPSRQAVWNAFWRKSVRMDPKLPLLEVVTFAADFLLPPMLAAAKGDSFLFSWKPGGPWQEGHA